MPVEFLPEGADETAPRRTPHRARRAVPRRLIAVAAALALVGAAAVVVATNGREPSHHHAAARPSSTPARPSPSVTSPSTLALPESVVFGPEAVDVLAIDSRIFALTPTLVGVTDRDSGALTVRPTPIGLSNRGGTGRLLSDTPNGILWVVAIGAQSIGAYDTQHLDTLTDLTAPYPINDAIAMDNRLYFTTDHGLYTAEPGPDPPTRVPGVTMRLGSVGVDRESHTVLAADYGSPSRLHLLSSYGRISSALLPVGYVDSIDVSGRAIWITGHSRGAATLFSIDPTTLRIFLVSPLDPQLGRRAAIVGDYSNRLLVSTPSTGALYCVSAFSGAFKQKWTVPAGSASTLNQRGLLVATKLGIQQRNARDCLAG